MLEITRLLIALILIVLITPQTERANIVLDIFHESGFFVDYREAELFVNTLPWFFSILFLVVCL